MSTKHHGRHVKGFPMKHDATLLNLIHMLHNGETTSLELVHYYLERIRRFNKKFNAVAETNPDALAIAEALDIERLAHGPRSLLHGIPILLKDNINTNDAMKTTAGSLALDDLYAPYEATVITKLRAAGMVILGKANLSEFAYFMSDDGMPSGYSSRKGQVINPYGETIDPLGSSTGSAVAVAANMVPVALGTETNGSLMAPAYMTSTVAIKPTFGLVSRYGIIPISEFQDTAGPMAKTVADCAYLLSHMIGYDENDPHTRAADLFDGDLTAALDEDITGLRIGRLRLGGIKASSEDDRVTDEAVAVLRQSGATVVDVAFTHIPTDNTNTLLYEFKNSLNAYLKTVSGSTAIESLKDIIDFNRRHPKTCLKHGQTLLEKAEETSGDLKDSVYLRLRAEILEKSKTFDQLFSDHHLDAIISTVWLSYAPIHGNPSIVVPAKPLLDDHPKSIVFVGPKFKDHTLVSIAHAYETKTKHRIPPK